MADTEETKLTLEDGFFDVYIRMKQSPEDDFCFEVNNKTTFRDLFDIFTTIPVVFSPSIFYDRIPIGFAFSYFPGVLTRTGSFIYDIEADNSKYLTEVTNLDETVKSKCLPGQLIVPLFRKRRLLHLSVLAFLAAWLYTDLPDFISPTPGICLTNYMTDAICYLLTNVIDKPEQAQKFYNDVHEPVTAIGQCFYFVFHIFKIALFYLILWAGLFNPYSWKKPSLNLEREDLIRLGWTGVKRVRKQGYQDEFRKLMLAKYGGIMNTYKNGKLSYISQCFVNLEEGEGYDSLKHPISLEGQNPSSPTFVLSRELLLKERAFLSANLSKMPYDKAYAELKKYRQVGPLHPSPEIQALTDARFKEINEKIAEKEASTNSALKRVLESKKTD